MKGMKKMIITHSMNVLLLLLLTVPVLANGGDAPRVQFNHIESTKKVSLVLEGLSSEAEIEVRANDGAILMAERLRGQASVERLLNLEALPAGRYLIVVATPLRDILQPVVISPEGMVLNQGLRRTYFAPAIRTHDRSVDVTLLNGRVANVELTLLNNRGEAVYQEEMGNVVQVQKRLNLDQLPRGLYTLKVRTPYKAYYKDIVLR